MASSCKDPKVSGTITSTSHCRQEHECPPEKSTRSTRLIIKTSRFSPTINALGMDTIFTTTAATTTTTQPMGQPQKPTSTPKTVLSKTNCSSSSDSSREHSEIHAHEIWIPASLDQHENSNETADSNDKQHRNKTKSPVSQCQCPGPTHTHPHCFRCHRQRTNSRLVLPNLPKATLEPPNLQMYRLQTPQGPQCCPPHVCPRSTPHQAQLPVGSFPKAGESTPGDLWLFPYTSKGRYTSSDCATAHGSRQFHQHTPRNYSHQTSQNCSSRGRNRSPEGDRTKCRKPCLPQTYHRSTRSPCTNPSKRNAQQGIDPKPARDTGSQVRSISKRVRRQAPSYRTQNRASTTRKREFDASAHSRNKNVGGNPRANHSCPKSFAPRSHNSIGAPRSSSHTRDTNIPGSKFQNCVPKTKTLNQHYKFASPASRTISPPSLVSFQFSPAL